MVTMTALALTRERERGTTENLLPMPVTPFEVILGKVLPFAAMGLAQFVVIVGAARLLFGVPMLGSGAALAASMLAFVAANPAMGFLFSTVAKNQLQAMQMSFFVFLSSILMSGFMFQFAGMPACGRTAAEPLPLTHFLRVARRHAQGQRLRRGVAEPLDAAPVSPRRADAGRRTLRPRTLD